VRPNISAVVVKHNRGDPTPFLPKGTDLVALENYENRMWHSMASALNFGLEAAKNDIVICVHPDVIFGKDFWQGFFEQLELIESWGALGIVGMTSIGRRCWCHYSNFNFPYPVQTLDECCIIVDKRNGLKFDDKTFNWHCYGADFCLQCLDRGLGVYVIGGDASHWGGEWGVEPPSYIKDRKRLELKWRNLKIYTT